MKEIKKGYCIKNIHDPNLFWMGLPSSE